MDTSIAQEQHTLESHISPNLRTI